MEKETEFSVGDIVAVFPTHVPRRIGEITAVCKNSLTGPLVFVKILFPTEPRPILFFRPEELEKVSDLDYLASAMP